VSYALYRVPFSFVGDFFTPFISKSHLSSHDGCIYRNRKALESRSLADDERITFLETQLKEAKYISEDADRKYDEVNAGPLIN